jgi:regulator of protease activity HflC (stomatin/prohibitin superfamily)
VTLISDIFSWLRERLYDLWPVRIIRDWEQGVRLRAGNVQALLTAHNGIGGTGVHLFWPLLGEIFWQHTSIRAAETSLQRLTTKDGVDVSVAFTLTYQIKDLGALFTKVHDFADSILDRVRGAAGLVVPELLASELSARLQPEMDAAVRKRVRGWGLDLIDLVPTQTSRAPALHLLGAGQGVGES